MGLANRIVPKGEARRAAEALAHDIARMPQLCLKNDRTSAYEQSGLSMHAALANEFRLGMGTLSSNEAREGAARFASGKGRGGSFEDL